MCVITFKCQVFDLNTGVFTCLNCLKATYITASLWRIYVILAFWIYLAILSTQISSCIHKSQAVYINLKLYTIIHKSQTVYTNRKLYAQIASCIHKSQAVCINLKLYVHKSITVCTQIASCIHKLQVVYTNQ